MKSTTFLLFVVCLVNTSVFAQATLDYTGYKIKFYDEFDYPPTTSIPPYLGASFINALGNSTVSNVTTNGTSFNSNWSMADQGGDTYHDEHFVEMIQQNGNPYGIIRLYEYSPACTTIAGRNIKNCTGFLCSRDINRVRYGILEARVKLPVGQTGAKGAFWTFEGPNGYTSEIDIFDVSYYNWTTSRILDWNYIQGCTYGGSFSDNIGIWPPGPSTAGNSFNVTANQTVPFNETIFDFSQDFHVYSCKWDPSYVTFYIDGMERHTETYDQARTYDFKQLLLLAVEADDDALDGYSMDVDWVKVWEKKCNDQQVNLEYPSYSSNILLNIVYNNNSYYFPFLIPELIKNNSILINVPTNIYGSPIAILKNEATIIEAESTTILNDFIADESTPLMLPMTLDGTCGNVTGIRNGFFEIRSTVCNNSDNGGNGGSSEGKPGRKNNMTETYTDLDHNIALTSPKPNNNSNSNDGTIASLENKFFGFKVAPNPTISFVNFTPIGNITYPVTLNVKDISGRILHTQEYNGDIRVELSPYSPGLYIIDIQTSSGIFTYKVTKF